MAAPSTALPRSAPTLPGGNEPVKLRSARLSPRHSFTKQPAEEKTGRADAPRTRSRRRCLRENEQKKKKKTQSATGREERKRNTK